MREAGDSLVLTLNIGTFACEAAVFDMNANMLMRVEESLTIRSSKPNYYEQEPRNWIDTIIDITRSISKRIDLNKNKIEAIVLTGHTQSLLLTDATLSPLTSCILWLDQRAIKEFEALRKDAMVTEELYKLTGIKYDVTIPLCKLLWIRRSRPKALSKFKRIYFSPKDYIAEFFTGRYVIDYPTASTTGFLNIHSGKWESYALDIAALDASDMPKLVKAHEVVGTLKSDVAEILGLKSGIPVIIGKCNVLAYALGAGVISSSQVADSTVASEIVSIPTDKPVLDPLQRIDCIIHAVPSKWLVVGAMMSSGIVLRWLMKNLLSVGNSREISLIDELASKSPPGARGLIVLPHFMGERTPYWNPKARGVIVGMTLGHSKEDLVRAFIESIGFGVKNIIEVFDELGLKPDDVRVIGPFAALRILREVKADILGIKISMPRYVDAACVGAYILGLVGTNYYNNIEAALNDVVKINEIVLPDLRKNSIYSKLYEIYKSTYYNLIEIFDNLYSATLAWTQYEGFA